MQTTKFTKAAALGLILAAGAVPAAQAGDWTGGYAGVYYGFDVTGVGPGNIMGVQIGYNFAGAGDLVYGIEGDFAVYASGVSQLYGVSGHAGFEIADDTLFYANLGAGQTGLGMTYWIAGVGGEYQLSSGAAIKAGVEWLSPINAPAPVATMAKVGIVMGF